MPTPPWVTVVSGLPRSGTSMLMQVLAAGGIAPLTDAERPADADNPRGYFELDAVKRTARDPSWVQGAVGKAVKVIHLLVPDLPAGYDYRVILLRRDMAEVLASQHAMLARSGRKGAALSDQQLGDVFTRQLERTRSWLARQPRVRVLEMEHARMLHDTAAAVGEIDAFLGGGLDRPAMMRAVDPSLHRQKG
jgi:hypothetical protein